MTSLPTTFDWLRDLPDPRDEHPNSPSVRSVLRALKFRRAVSMVTADLDLRKYFREVESAAVPGAGPAQSCVELVQYFERRATGRDRSGAVAFVANVGRRLQGQSAGSLRSVLKVAMRFGVPPARNWPKDSNPAAELPPYLFAFADGLRGARYFRVSGTKETLVEQVQSFLVGGFACVLGFSVPGSLTGGPDIPVPTAFDTILGGEAAVVVGYENARRIRSSRGALLVRPSWGPDWGDKGYGWLPYDYLRRGLAADVWTLVHPRWLKSGEFGWRS